MARAVGLDAGVHEVKVVELDGSYRKPRLTKVSIDRVPGGTSAELAIEGEAEAALHALKDQHIKLDTVNLGFPCRDAVLRTLKIPFVGDDAIRKVIKFEVENTIHSHSVDDMVVDFLTYARGEGESSVLVAAVPKKTLGVLLGALEKQGLEPERVELDTMALYRVAEWAGCFGEAAAAKDAPDASVATTAGAALPAASSGRRARIVIDIGAGSTRTLAVVGGTLVDMRAMRIGTDAIVEDLAVELGLAVEVVRDAVREALVTGVDVAIPEGPAAAVAEGEDAGELPAKASIVTHDLVDRAREKFLERLGREILRFVGEMHGLDRDEIRRRCDPLVERLGLADATEEYAMNYSKGMKKKLALLCAMMHDPALLILDEPTNGLDPHATRTLIEIVKEKVAQGRTVFFSTHLLDQAEKLCHRIGILYKGRLAATGTLDELRAKLASGGSLEEIFFAVTGGA